MSDTQPALHTRIAAEIGPGLAWIHARAWPLGGMGLGITVLCLVHYARQEQVPLDMTSPSMIAAVPVLFALISFAAMALTTSFLLPACLLIVQPSPGCPSLADLLAQDKNDADRTSAFKDARSAARKRITRAWFGAIFLQTALLAIAVAPTYYFPALTETTLYSNSVVLLVIALASLLTIRSTGQPAKKLSFDFWLFLAGGGASQLLCVTLLLQLTLQRLSNDTPIAMLVFIATLIGLGAIQLAVAVTAYELRNHARPLAMSLRIAGVAILLFTLIPPVGAKLASFALRAPLTGGAECIEVTWMPGRMPPETGRWLYITAPAGDVLLAHKPYQSDTTYFVRRDAIQSMTGIGCREAESRMNAEHTRATQASGAPPLPASAEQAGDAH